MSSSTLSFHERYKKELGRKLLFILGSVVLFIVVVVWSASVGSANIGAVVAFKAILGFPVSDLAYNVIWELRLPRILMGVVAGAGFAVSGSAMQGILRNPLVSPFTIGISSAAGFGASLAIVTGIGFMGAAKYLVMGNAFVFALLAALIVLGIAKFKGASAEIIILTGIAIMYLFSALTSLMQYTATEHQLQGVVFWLFGNLSMATWNNLLVMFVVIVACLPVLIYFFWDLNALAHGDETAVSIGVRPDRVRMAVLFVSSLITAVIVCFTGVIGFVCLVSPHITRMLIGNDHRFLLPCSSVIGAILLVASDTLGRIIIHPVELPVGIVTSFIGVPMFIYLIVMKRKNYWS
ncbi:MAG: iron ABC transporter permease [Bacteroidales bacterium]